MHRRGASPRPLPWLAVLAGCARVAFADPAPAPPRDGCVFGATVDAARVKGYLDGWLGARGLGPAGVWDLGLDRDAARLDLEAGAGTLQIRWRLARDCAPTDVESTVVRGFATTRPGPDDLAALARDFPAPRVRLHTAAPRRPARP